MLFMFPFDSVETLNDWSKYKNEGKFSNNEAILNLKVKFD
jgi:hypothetical protein